jgi:orotate phosphoribosyltransferase
MNAQELLREQIVTKAVVHGKVILSSGKEADYYVDLRRVTLDHVAAPLVGEVMLELTKDLEFDAVGGLTLGADPVATAMMHVIHSLSAKLKKLTAYSAASKVQMLWASESWQSKTHQLQAVQY